MLMLFWETGCYNRYYGDTDTGSEYYSGKTLEWGDCDHDDDFGRDYGIDREGPPSRMAVRRQEGRRAVAPFKHPPRAVAPIRMKESRLQDVETRRTEPDSSVKRFVTFYISNFPPQASNFFLRKGFEVCGIIEDVFVANTRNMYDEVYGFVRFAKVRDTDKLLKALKCLLWSI